MGEGGGGGVRAPIRQCILLRVRIQLHYPPATPLTMFVFQEPF